jgi:type I restriction enzyme S subunit
LLSVLSAHLLRSQIESKAKSTSGVNNINSGELQGLIVPICSISEQELLAARLEGILSSILATEKEIITQLKRANSLRHSILKKAVSGQLVAQHQNDEPASVLLERIRAEMEDRGNRRKKAKKNNGKREAA